MSRLILIARAPQIALLAAVVLMLAAEALLKRAGP